MATDVAESRELKERVIEINRVAKVVSGGRRFSFTALVVIGDEVDNVGVGYGKAREVPLAIAKAVDDAKKNLFRVPKHGTTITHEIIGEFDAARVLLRPASEGTGVIAGGGVRAVLELAGVRDILAKSLGTTNPINMAKATVDGLQKLRRPEDVARMRGKTVSEVLPVGSRAREDASEARGEPAGDGDEGVADRVKQAAAGVAERVPGAGAVAGAVSAVADRAKDLPGADSVVEAAKSVADRAKDLPGVDAAADAASGIVERVKDAVSGDDDEEKEAS